MNKKVLAILIILINIAFLMSGCKDNGLHYEYIAEYGQNFTLPYYGKGSYELFDSNSNSINNYNRSFIVDDINGYTIRYKGEQRSINACIKVVDSTGPVIVTDYEIKYAVKNGEKIVFPNIAVFDAYDKDPQVEKSLDYNGENYAYTSDGFIPDEYGVYTLNVSARDNSGNISIKKVVYQIVKDEFGLTDVIAAFSDIHGLTHIGNKRGFDIAFSNELYYGQEGGSTELTVNGDEWFAPNFCLRNLIKTDLSCAGGIYFRIYNGLSKNICFSINWAYAFSLSAGKWNDIFISKNDFEKMQQTRTEMFLEKSDISNINGLYFAFYSYDGDGLEKGSLYLSNIYELPDYSVNELNAIIQNFPQTFTDDDIHPFKRIRKSYGLLSEIQSTQIIGYGILLNNYYEYLIEKHNVIPNNGTLLYFDSELGKEQIECDGCETNYTETVYCNQNGRDETGSLEVKTLGSWSAKIKFDLILSETEKSYENAEVYIKCPYYEGYSFYVNYVNDKIGQIMQYDLAEGWNRIEVNINQRGIAEGCLEIYCGKYEKWDNPIPAGINFYLSSVIGL